MLRASFPLAVRAAEATYDVQFGSVRRPTHRNTSWDLAKFEVCGQKWVDLSQGDYGVALLNDCKYGHAVEPSAISLNLLRSPSHPDPVADQATHEFTYAVYPHPGGAQTSGVGRAGYELNVPVVAMLATQHEGTRPAAASLFQVDAANVVIETVKLAEEGDGVIVRAYESQGMATRTCLYCAFPIAGSWEGDLMEEHAREIAGDAVGVALDFAPFEIRTVRLALC